MKQIKVCIWCCFIPLFAACFDHSTKRADCTDSIKSAFEKISVNDTLDLNLNCLDFDQLLVLSPELSLSSLLSELNLEPKSQLILKNKAKNYHTWAVAWTKDTVLMDWVEFLPTQLILDNLVDHRGYAVIKRSDMRKLLVVSKDEVFVGTQDTVLDVIAIEKIEHTEEKKYNAIKNRA